MGYLNIFNIYKIFSLYGTSYWVAAGWLACFVFLAFPLAFLLSGFNINQANIGSIGSTIQYEMRFDPGRLGNFVSDYIKAVGFSLSTATLQKSRSYEPSGLLTSFWMSVESIVTAAQSALLFFALRRRFKR
jgi:hypothetical protein